MGGRGLGNGQLEAVEAPLYWGCIGMYGRSLGVSGPGGVGGGGVTPCRQ